MEKKIGIIKTVARTGGIIFEGEDKYWNPSGKCKEYVTPELRGKKVEIDIMGGEQRTFSFISEVKDNNSGQRPETKTFQKATDYVPENEERINSMSLAYSKDLVSSGKIKLIQIGEYALLFKQFIKTGIMPKIEEDIFVESVDVE